MLIVLEGIDNCGKTTLSDVISEYYFKKNKTVFISKELTTDIGELIKHYVKKDGLSSILKTFLFAADRQLRLEKLVENKYDILIMDRYLYSAIVYREAEGVEGSWVREVNRNIMKADISFYIDITAEESILRNSEKKFNIIYSKDFLEKIRTKYIEKCETGELIYINGMQSLTKVFKEIQFHLDAYEKK